ncbi:uncharacterized protein LOC126398404 [Epinephelus moara]|uniref:uncharacterized protein LOC126398404 n=1 Tax=Epinephelus moara TaxID=300413 RepID=UPI00214E9BE4|nr:uncharacterized protein LOC126398404 [Epinephelus moara]
MAELCSQKTPAELVDVCRVCGDSFSPTKRNKHNVLQGHGLSVRPDYTLALEDITGERVTQGDGLPKAVCGTCRTLLRRYGRSKADVEGIGSFVKEKATTVPRFKTCAPSTPSQQLKREPGPPEDSHGSSPALRKLFPSGEAEGTDPDDMGGVVSLDDGATSSMNAEQHVAAESRPEPQQPQRVTKVIVTHGPATLSRIVTGPIEKIAMCLQRNHTKRLPKLVMDVPGLDNIAIKQVFKRVDKECQKLTGNKWKSILKKTTPSDLKKFSWDKVLDEWKEKAPTFLQFLKCASTVSTEKGEGNARAKICKMAMAGATLLRARSKFMCAPMYLNALLMQHAGAKKRCYDRFGRIGISVNRRSCLRKLKTISLSWDKKYLKWKRNICARSSEMAEQCLDHQPLQHDQQTAACSDVQTNENAAPSDNQSLGSQQRPPNDDNDGDAESIYAIKAASESDCPSHL